MSTSKIIECNTTTLKAKKHDLLRLYKRVRRCILFLPSILILCKNFGLWLLNRPKKTAKNQTNRSIEVSNETINEIIRIYYLVVKGINLQESQLPECSSTTILFAFSLILPVA